MKRLIKHIVECKHNPYRIVNMTCMKGKVVLKYFPYCYICMVKDNVNIYDLLKNN